MQRVLYQFWLHQYPCTAYYTREHPDLRFQLDALLESQGPEWIRLYNLVQAGIQKGVVKPLKRAIYGMDKIVDAFRAVEAQKDTSKAVIKVSPGCRDFRMVLRERNKLMFLLMVYKTALR